jgi:3-deoxy-D-manno-octulosonate 8-phosphate phosphatase (KDO 8-P phosphatase)
VNDVWPLKSAETYRDEVRQLVGEPLLSHLQRVRLLVVDCDGILTSGALLYGPDGEALKDFHARDGLGLMMLRAAGIRRAVITGRESPIVERRCRDLSFEAILLGRYEKAAALDEVLAATGCAAADTLVMGDDLLDLPPMTRAGVAVTVPGAPEEVRAASDWVTRAAGGRGAVREVCDLVLKSQGRYGTAIQALVASGPPHKDSSGNRETT